MYNILHLVSSRGIGDTMRPRRAPRPHPVVQPAGASHLTLIVGDAAAAADGDRRHAAGARPPSTLPRPSGT